MPFISTLNPQNTHNIQYIIIIQKDCQQQTHYASVRLKTMHGVIALRIVLVKTSDAKNAAEPFFSTDVSLEANTDYQLFYPSLLSLLL